MTATLASVLNSVATYLCGPYDATRRWYANGANPAIPGLYVVKRARQADTPDDMWDYGTANGAAIGCYGLLRGDETAGEERRIAFGVKMVQESVELQCFFRGATTHSEDTADAMTAMKDAIVARIRADRTCGSGGFENGGFQIAETAPWLRFDLSEVHRRTGIDKATLTMLFEAHYTVQA